ncbi:MAG TPA: hypothetical protein VEY10_11070 [Flavisolibacter sp.]|jgi:hypothetical protein|nr:hypothetical protein [Flavisolibacter sp.]
MRRTVQVVRTTVLICALSLTTFFSKAQSISTANGKFEIGLGLGPLIFLGDLGGGLGKGSYFVKDVNLPVTKMAKGIFVNYYPQEWLGFRVAANMGVLEGADSLIKEKGGAETYRQIRNLHFRSKLLEAYAAIELYPTVFFEEFDGLQGKVRPYGVIGVGMIKFNPQAQYHSPNGTSRWVDLQPLRTEGQGMKEYANRPMYKLTSMEIPVGVGVKWYVKENMYVGFEVLHRKTFTDYIDDVSTTYINPQLFSDARYFTPEQSAMAIQMNNRDFNNTGALSRRYVEGDERGHTRNDSFFSSVLRFGWRLFDNSETAGMGCPKW